MYFWCCNGDNYEGEVVKQKPRHHAIEKTQLQIMGNKQNGNYLLVRHTQKNFFVDVLQRKKKNNEPVSPMVIYFSLFEKGVKIDPHEEQYLVQEKVLEYIARRAMEVAPQVIVDAHCRSGSAVIQLAMKSSGIVIGLNPLLRQINNGIHNASLYNVDNYSFLQSHTSQINLRDVDVLYIHPEFEQPDSVFSVAHHLKPNIAEILEFPADNYIIILPKIVSLHEFSEQLAFYIKKMHKQIFKIEIQQTQVDGYLSNYIVYIGEIAALALQDEYELMASLLIEDLDETHFEQTYQFLKQLLIPSKAILDMIMYAESETKETPEIRLSVFAQQLLRNNYTTQDKIKEFLPTEDVYNAQTPQYNEIAQQTFGNMFKLIYARPFQDMSLPKKRKTQFISFNRTQPMTYTHDNDLLMDK